MLIFRPWATFDHTMITLRMTTARILVDAYCLLSTADKTSVAESVLHICWDVRNRLGNVCAICEW